MSNQTNPQVISNRHGTYYIMSEEACRAKKESNVENLELNEHEKSVVDKMTDDLFKEILEFLITSTDDTSDHGIKEAFLRDDVTDYIGFFFVMISHDERIRSLDVDVEIQEKIADLIELNVKKLFESYTTNK